MMWRAQEQYPVGGDEDRAQKLNATAECFRRIDQCAFDLLRTSDVSDALRCTFGLQGMFIYHGVILKTQVVDTVKMTDN